MARTPAGLGEGARITDHISLGVLVKMLPLERVRAVIAASGKSSIRQRDLPAHVVMYYVIAMGLYMQVSQREVLRCLLEGVQWLMGPKVRVRVAGKSILDPKTAPAEELAALYHERWEIETALDELKTHLRGAQIVLRSKTPNLVKQEFYGLLMAHFAVRGLMHEAALHADEDPDRLSFLHAVRVVRRKLPLAGAISPSAENSLS